MGNCWGKPEPKKRQEQHPALDALVPSRTASFDSAYTYVRSLREGGPYKLSLLESNHPEDDKQYVLKEIDLASSDPERIQDFRNEVDILRHLDHPHIVKAYEVYEDDEKISVVMEHCVGGDLTNRGPFSEADSAHIMLQIVQAVNHLHTRRIMWRDCKMENVTFKDEEQLNVKIIDFGLSTPFTSGQHMTKKTGTAYTMAPDVLLGSYTEIADMWSVGVVAYQVLSGRRPFWSRSPREILKQVLRGKWRFEGEAWDYISDAAKDFVTRLLVVDPQDRMSSAEAMRHPWLQGHITSDPLVQAEVLQAMKDFAKFTVLRRLVLQVVAYLTPDDDLGDLNRVFKALDREQVGFLSRGDLLAAMKSTNKDLKERHIQKIFDQVDVAKNERIEYNEFVAATLMTKEDKLPESILRRSFERLDVDSSGCITKANLRSCLSEIVKEKAIDDMLHEAGFKVTDEIAYDTFRNVCLGKDEHWTARPGADLIPQ